MQAIHKAGAAPPNQAHGRFGIDKEVDTRARVHACAKAFLAACPGSYIQSQNERCVNINIPLINSSVMFYTFSKE